MIKSHTYIALDELMEMLGYPEDAEFMSGYIEAENPYLHIFARHEEEIPAITSHVVRGAHTEPVHVRRMMERVEHGS